MQQKKEILEPDSVLQKEQALHIYLSVVSGSRNLIANSEYFI